MEGTFYEEELQKVKRPDIFRIEKVLKKHTKNKKMEYLVYWPDFDSWISHQILTISQKMNENSQRVSFHLVLPSTSNHEIFLENHTGKLCYPKKFTLIKSFIRRWL